MIRNLGIVVAAGGSGNRYGSKNKLLETLGGVPVFIRCLETFSRICPGKRIVLVVPSAEKGAFASALNVFMPDNEIIVAVGGSSRARSVINGLEQIADPAVRFVAVHDAARPFVTSGILERCLEYAEKYGAAVPAKPVTDTLKCVSADMLIAGTVDRSVLWRVETPQIFELAKLKSAYAAMAERLDDFTDDASVMEAAGFDVALVETPENNLKITYSQDMEFAELLCRRR